MKRRSLISGTQKLRPCVRQDFLNFLFSLVSEKFRIFLEKTEFLNSWNFRKKSSEKSVNLEIFLKSMKSLSFWVKKPCFLGQKVWKKFKKSL